MATFTRYLDYLYAYRAITALVTPFDETDAYKMGIIDEKGKRIRKPRTKEEKNSYTVFTIFLFNMKKLLNKIPGGSTKFASYATAMYLIKENGPQWQNVDMDKLHDDIDDLVEKALTQALEDAPATSTANVDSYSPLVEPVGEKDKKKKKTAVVRRKLNTPEYVGVSDE